ncbi:hypothetical protein A3A95_02615 [Candidatus Nomurabacteria bacterium RIFCSPLOWO2_01_FULL_39_18]|uniref:Dihydrofolate reductase n=1 Tax=Candidatus Nomurabacteria bacterium RIFCSPHIGHO2_01_FULL_40_24b TaxID=1801739 RepID=A0A1F6V6Y4_9BACT|nr:MAG: hypothetical protein A2647_01075 [Candidatus Nomurabacteria bacterium RIFCSPHIGHO2_01_FULL_40_24b]OGI90751.1 MAG: hypothetical protein A3A95_02615 [Candidatus Nomurabacteria bacterium RIFCSPLOWO2_01_FULL_39_18]
MISLIAAIGRNNELGKGNDLVWKFPADQKFFRETTSGHPIIMGRKTFESLGRSLTGEPIGRPLPNRQNIVITRDKNYLRNGLPAQAGVDVVHSLDEALKLVSKEEEVFIIGGAEIFRQAMSTADRLYITHFDAEDKGADVFFPEIVPVVWNEISHQEFKPDSENPIPYIFSVYEKFT